MVVVGHSMGGLLAKMMVVEPGDHLWRVVSDRPFDELAGDSTDRDMFHRALFFSPRPEVRRVVFIATPHRGSRLDRGSLHHIGTRLVRVPDPLRAAHDRLIAGNPPMFFKDHFRKALPTSIDDEGWSAWLDDERVQAQPGDFYGGWITSDLIGPFKGLPGTRGW